MMDQAETSSTWTNNVTFITQGHWPRWMRLVDWLIEKKKSGYKMVNSASGSGKWSTSCAARVQDGIAAPGSIR